MFLLLEQLVGVCGETYRQAKAGRIWLVMLISTAFMRLVGAGPRTKLPGPQPVLRLEPHGCKTESLSNEDSIRSPSAGGQQVAAHHS